MMSKENLLPPNIEIPNRNDDIEPSVRTKIELNPKICYRWNSAIGVMYELRLNNIRCPIFYGPYSTWVDIEIFETNSRYEIHILNRYKQEQRLVFYEEKFVEWTPKVLNNGQKWVDSPEFKPSTR